MSTKTDDYKWDFFIAHAGADKASAEKVYDFLEPHARVFLDSRCLILGDDWDRKLAEAQRSALVTIVLISSNTEKAYYQREEIAAAIALARANEEAHRVVPVYLDHEIAVPNAVPYGLRLKHGLTVSDELGFDGVAGCLLELLVRLGNTTLSGTSASTATLSSSAKSDTEAPQLIFETRPNYPQLNFSILNRSNKRMQITSLRVIKGGSVKDNHTGGDFLTGPRLQLEYSLKDAKDGEVKERLGDRVSNIGPEEAEAFSLKLECENTVNLIDLEVEHISRTSRQPTVSYPEEIIVVHCPAPDKNAYGSIKVMNRNKAFQILLNREPLKLWAGTKYADCETWKFLFLRAVGCLAIGDIENNWALLLKKYENTNAIGPILASFAELTQRYPVPQTIIDYLHSTVRDPRKLKKLLATDTEAYGLTIANALAQIPM